MEKTKFIDLSIDEMKSTLVNISNRLFYFAKTEKEIFVLKKVAIHIGLDLGSLTKEDLIKLAKEVKETFEL